MNDSPRKASPLRQRMLEEMWMRQLAPKTRDAYIRAVLHFTRFLGRSPDTATAEDLRRYQLHCVDRGICAITLNATITGLKFLFEATLGQPELMAKTHPVRMSRTLPIILSREEVSRLLGAAKNLKHQTALSVAYGAGLRVADLLNTITESRFDVVESFAAPLPIIVISEMLGIEHEMRTTFRKWSQEFLAGFF